jgi:transposase
VAVAHSLLTIIYALLARGSTYADLGAAYFDERDRQHTRQRLVGRLERLGYRVNLAVPTTTG